MISKLPRRKRQLVFTSVFSVGIILIAAAILMVPGSQEPAYQPGETVDGIMADLARSMPEAYTPVTFTDVTEKAGIDFVHFWGQRSSQLPEDMGSGAAWGDYDNDGWPDLYVANLAGPLTLTDEAVRQSPAHARLYHNNKDGTFTDVSRKAGVAYQGWSNGAAWGDYDRDGWLDLVVTTYGPIVLYHNNGDGTFTDISSVTGFDHHRGFWGGAAWGDYNRDGWLDLYVPGYVRYRRLAHNEARAQQYEVENPASINPSSFDPAPNLLFHNRGDGRFEEVALPSGVSNPEGRSLSAAWVDIDEDGWSDLYVANDVSDNVLFRNLGNGTFEDLSHAARVADYRGAMGIAVGDWDGDTDLDMVVTHWIAQENALYNNQLAQDRADGRDATIRFADEADRYGLGQIALDYIGWATAFVDIDNDGHLDLYVANGSTFQQRDDPTRLVPMRSQLFWNGGPDSGFYDVSSASGPSFSEPFVGRGAAFADYDRDGDLDVFLVHHGEQGVLLRNDGGNRRNWLAVRLEGQTSNRQGIGARLRLVAGGMVQVRQVGAQASYYSQNDNTEHFGLGAAGHIDTLEVLWPSGIRQVRTGLPANQFVQLTEPDAAL